MEGARFGAGAEAKRWERWKTEGRAPSQRVQRQDETQHPSIRNIKFEGKKVRCFTFTADFTGTVELEEIWLMRGYVH